MAGQIYRTLFWSRGIEAVMDGTQSNRTWLLETELPVSWTEQEALLGFTA